jgi:hypothetical protein
MNRRTLIGAVGMHRANEWLTDVSYGSWLCGNARPTGIEGGRG